MKIQSLLMMLVLTLAPIAVTGAAADHGGDEADHCTDVGGAADQGYCADFLLPDSDPDCVDSDILWSTLCTLLTAAGGELGEGDIDEDGRADTAIVRAPVNTGCDPNVAEGGNPTDCVDTSADGGEKVHVQIDFFRGDGPSADIPTTVGPIMVLDPLSGQVVAETEASVEATAAEIIIRVPDMVISDGGFFPDGKGFLLDEVHIAYGNLPYSDLDGDGDTDFREVVVCRSNPLNPAAHCGDLDGDGREQEAGGDDDEYTPYVPDSDGDGVKDDVDNCPDTPNPDQADLDGDGVGDACDDDIDGDGVPNADDRDPTSGKDCSQGATGTGSDRDGDGCKNSEDPDQDGDGVLDEDDNCPTVSNPDQADTTEMTYNPDEYQTEGDGVGDACDNDKDGDGSSPDSLDGEGFIASGDCDDTDPDVGEPETGSCDADEAVGLILAALEDDPSSPTALIAPVINALQDQDCSLLEDETPDKCSDDSLDQEDVRDTDGDGITDESNGQTDVVEERLVYYTTYTDAALDLHVVTPEAGFGTPPADALRIIVGDPDADDDIDVHAIVVDSTASGDAYCVYDPEGDLPLAVGVGASIEEACDDRVSAIGPINDVLAQTAAVNEAFGPEGAPPVVQFVDEDGDGIPEALVVGIVDPATCGPAEGDPGIACGEFIVQVIPFGGVPELPSEEPDEDGDGVPDDEDDCQGTPEGARVDENGCELPDDDGDGVYNEDDLCPGTASGTQVNDEGCPDEDGDGVKDDDDQCPGTEEGATVDETGCPEELLPVPGIEPVEDENGNPGLWIDLDGDGEQDEGETIFAQIGTEGCPVDPVGGAVRVCVLEDGRLYVFLVITGFILPNPTA